MLYDDETQGHDSQVENITIDALGQTVSLRLSSYPSMEAPERVPIEITFAQVTSVNAIADLSELADHHSPGNLAYWNIAHGPGTSYFHLVQGWLAITSRSAPVLTYRQQ